MERPPLGGKGYQRDEASSRFSHFEYFSLNGVYIYFFKKKAFVMIFGDIFSKGL